MIQLCFALNSMVQALRLICELCVHYQIFDVSLWSKILEQLLSMHLVSVPKTSKTIRL